MVVSLLPATAPRCCLGFFSPPETICVKCSSRGDKQSNRWRNKTSSCGDSKATHREDAVTLGFGSFCCSYHWKMEPQ
ncbi:unnamed protein product [Brassica oleracea var. botrytis]